MEDSDADFGDLEGGGKTAKSTAASVRKALALHRRVSVKNIVAAPAPAPEPAPAPAAPAPAPAPEPSSDESSSEMDSDADFGDLEGGGKTAKSTAASVRKALALHRRV